MKTNQSKRRTVNPFISTMIIILVALLIIAVATCFIPIGANNKLISLIVCIVFVFLFVAISYLVYSYKCEKKQKEEDKTQTGQTSPATSSTEVPIPDVRQEETIIKQTVKMVKKRMKKFFKKGKTNTL